MRTHHAGQFAATSTRTSNLRACRTKIAAGG